jgi:hypothetical protein
MVVCRWAFVRAAKVVDCVCTCACAGMLSHMLVVAWSALCGLQSLEGLCLIVTHCCDSRVAF